MSKHMAPGRVLDIVTVIVSLTWGASFVSDIWVPNYESPTGINQVMMMLVGFLIAGKTQVGKGSDEDEPPTKESGK